MVQSRALLCGLIGAPPKPGRLIDCDLTHILALTEAVLCEHEKTAEAIQQAYDDARPLPPAAPVATGEQRRRDIDRFLNI